MPGGHNVSCVLNGSYWRCMSISLVWTFDITCSTPREMILVIYGFSDEKAALRV
jgi:hypothetical protein